MVDVVFRFLVLNNINVSREYLDELLTSHPQYPSLLSIADAFDRLNVNLQVSRIERSELNTFKYPYLLPLDGSDGEILLIEHKKNLAAAEDQLSKWQGLILKVEGSTLIDNVRNSELRAKETFIQFINGTLIVLAVAFSTLVLWQVSWLVSWIWMFGVAGIYVSWQLFTIESGRASRLASAVCGAQSNSSCLKIIDSNISILGWITLVDLAVIYFLSQLSAIAALALNTVTLMSEFILLTGVFSIISIVVLILSIAYQAFKGVWCRLCLLLDAVLVIQLVGYAGILRDADLSRLFIDNWIHLAYFVLFIVFIIILLVMYKDHTRRANNAHSKSRKFGRIAYNGRVFKVLLHSTANRSWRPFPKEMIIGDKSAPVQILVVTNLFCLPCKRKFPALSSLVRQFPDKVGLSFRVVFSSDGPEAVMYFLQYWEERVNGTKEESRLTEELFNDWFVVMDFDKFRETHKITTNHINNDIGKLHYEWSMQNQIFQTPLVFVNGYELPAPYEIDDLENIVNGLAEELEIEKKYSSSMNVEKAVV